MDDQILRVSPDFLKEHGVAGIITTLVVDDLVFDFEFLIDKFFQSLNIIFLLHHHVGKRLMIIEVGPLKLLKAQPIDTNHAIMNFQLPEYGFLRIKRTARTIIIGLPLRY
jgi:hypothetical protein